MTELRVWAPNAGKVRLWLDGGIYAMDARPDGWWVTDVTADVVARGPGDYGFLLDEDEQVYPDPASRHQPNGVHQPSRLYHHSAFAWTDSSWTGRALPGAIVYELHIGTFTSAGTFDAAIEHLAHLVDLGVTHLEVLPVNAVNGQWNWGYDGVGWYATHEPYGGPDGFKRFVDASHAHGLAVVLDVVYNHLGPSGNYLPKFGPYFNDGSTIWGALVNLDGEHSASVRRFIVENALTWLADFHLDGLRLDAVHALQDTSSPHLLEQLAVEVDALSARLGRPLTLVAESDLNDPAMVTPPEAGGRGMQAQWNDDVHHALHALITGERHGYYGDFGSLAVTAKVLTSAFLHDGTYSTFRGRVHGHPVDRDQIPGDRFVVCLQNHDQVGNRAAGERLTELASPAMQRIGAVLLMTSPFTPMLWMGEEWAATTRWPYFTSHQEPELIAIASQKRIDEFAGHDWDVAQMIDPQDPRAFHDATLDWTELSLFRHRQMLEFYRRLIALRHAEPDLADPRLDRIAVEFDEDAGWIVVHRGRLRVAANLSDQPQTLPVVTTQLLLSTSPASIASASVDPASVRTGQLRLGAQTAVVARVGDEFA